MEVSIVWDALVKLLQGIPTTMVAAVVFAVSMYFWNFGWRDPVSAQLMKQYGQWVPLAAVTSGALCLMFLGKSGWKRIDGWLARRKVSVAREKQIEVLVAHLADLRNPEKHVLQRYLEEGRTVAFSLGDEAVASLASRRILYPMGGLINMARPPYTINTEVWDHLQLHPELIETPDDPRYRGRDGWMR